MDWFLCDIGLRHEIVKDNSKEGFSFNYNVKIIIASLTFLKKVSTPKEKFSLYKIKFIQLISKGFQIGALILFQN